MNERKACLSSENIKAAAGAVTYKLSDRFQLYKLFVQKSLLGIFSINDIGALA